MYEKRQSFFIQDAGCAGLWLRYRKENLGNKGNAMKKYAVYPFEIGKIVIMEEAGLVTNLFFLDGEPSFSAISEETPVLRQTAAELKEYFSGGRKDFTVPLAPKGTPFQRSVWKALENIPYGETRTYQQIAEEVGKPKAYRAVGMANHNNPIWILIPCHRVVGKDGGLTGYAGGLERKQFLLKLENKKR